MDKITTEYGTEVVMEDNGDFTLTFSLTYPEPEPAEDTDES